jgi:hypothetical protein
MKSIALLFWATFVVATEPVDEKTTVPPTTTTPVESARFTPGYAGDGSAVAPLKPHEASSTTPILSGCDTSKGLLYDERRKMYYLPRK